MTAVEPKSTGTRSGSRAFGNYVNREFASRIGLLEFSPDIVEPAGNTVLRGGQLARFEREDPDYARIEVEHTPLAADPEFQEAFVESLRFP